MWVIFVEFVCTNATKKDIDVITSIKLVTMIDNVMDKKLSYEERKKIEDTIKKEIKENYMQYQIIYVDKKRAGVYITVPYKKGVMIDEIYLFEEFRNKGIGTKIINNIRNEYSFTYIWLYKDNKDMYRFLRRIGFMDYDVNNRILIMRINDIGPKIIKQMETIRNGFVDRRGNYYHRCKEDFYDVYYLQKPQDLMESNVGLCFDQVELERFYLSKYDINLRTYYLIYQDGLLGPSHSFLIYKDNNKYYWLENSWLKHRGIHEYESKESAFLDIANKFGKTIINFKKERLKLYEFEKPRYGTGYEKYKVNAFNGKVIKIFRG